MIEASFMGLVAIPAGLGLIGFIEPCSIGSSLVFIKYLEGKSRTAKLVETLLFALTRALFIGLLGVLAVLIGTVFLDLQRSAWLLLGASYVLLGLLLATGRAGGLMVSLGPSLRQLSNRGGSVGLGLLFGVRPLVLGKIDNAYILASETCALDIIGADFVRDVSPGEVVVVDETGISTHFPFSAPPKRFCIFEHIYFSRPDSVVEGRSVYDVRKDIGRQLATENPVEADLIIPVPDSGTPAAIGYAEKSGIPFDLGIIRNHYVGRTFIEPTDQIRHLGVKLKHNANRALISGKRVILVDDSIVRGTTSTKIVQMVREAGATEVHMRIASPPTTHSCFYGVDTPSRNKLLAAQYDLDEMCAFIGADSLNFISLDGLYIVMGEDGRNAKQPQYCDACFTGDYPIELVDNDTGADKELTLLAERY